MFSWLTVACALTCFLHVLSCQVRQSFLRRGCTPTHGVFHQSQSPINKPHADLTVPLPLSLCLLTAFVYRRDPSFIDDVTTPAERKVFEFDYPDNEALIRQKEQLAEVRRGIFKLFSCWCEFVR